MTSFEFNKIKESINSNLSYLDRREEIFSNFINNGFPNKRNESWRYFDLASKSKSYVKKNISNSQIIVENLHENNIFYDCLENNLSKEDYFKPCSYFKNERGTTMWQANFHAMISTSRKQWIELLQRVWCKDCKKKLSLKLGRPRPQ